MKALSIRQPWVHAIFREGKDIENRTWRTHYRGWIAIHASASIHDNAEFPKGYMIPDHASLDCSAICGVARLADVVERHRSRWFDRSGGTERRNFGWVLDEVTALQTPIACKGARGLWNIPRRIELALYRQLPCLKTAS